VNVGAYDGVTNDPIYPFLDEHHWRGIAIEPIPESFELLQANYRDQPQVTLVNAAISDVARPIWRVRGPSDPADRTAGGAWPWDVLEQMSSMEGERLEADLTRIFAARSANGIPMPPVADVLAPVDVRCVGFNDLMVEHGVERVDLVNIDAERADLDVLRAIDLDRYEPRVIVIEVSEMSEADHREMRTILRPRGFQRACTFEPFSTVFVRG
jgi:FkbM family methyltransferase